MVGGEWWGGGSWVVGGVWWGGEWGMVGAGWWKYYSIDPRYYAETDIGRQVGLQRMSH